MVMQTFCMPKMKRFAKTVVQLLCVTFAQTAPFSDLPVAERSGRMDKKMSAAENEK